MTQPPASVHTRPARDTRVDIARPAPVDDLCEPRGGILDRRLADPRRLGAVRQFRAVRVDSGLMPGSVVARKSIRQDWGAARRDMPLRTLRLYRTQLIVFALVGMENLAFPSVLHALALVWLGPRVVPRQADGMGVAICRWLAAAGRFSLQVFSLALFLSWGVTAAFRLWPGAVRGLGPLLLAGCAILLAFGRWLEHRRQDAPALGPAPAGLPWMEAAE